MSEEQKSAAATEQEMIEKALQSNERTFSQDPEEVASALLTLYRPRYEVLVNSLSSNAMRRLLKKMIEYPLGDKERRATTKEEGEAFAIAERLLEAKFVLITSTLNKQLQKELEEQVEEQKESQNG